jgi:hypothetical protein
VDPLDLGSFSRTMWTSKSFELPNFPTPQIHVRNAWAVETKGHLFLGKQIDALSHVTHIKLGATILIVFCRFSLLLSHLSLPSPFTAPWLTPLSMTPLLLLSHRSTTMTTSTTPGWKASRWQPLHLQPVAPPKWWTGKSQISPTSLRR